MRVAIARNLWWFLSVACLAVLCAALVTGCGGGGSGPEFSRYVGTYDGSYTFPPSSLIPGGGGGDFDLRVHSDGSAEGVFDQFTSSEILITGEVDSSGRIELFARETNANGVSVTTRMNGQILSDGSSASGQIQLEGNGQSIQGSFNLIKISDSILKQSEQTPNGEPDAPQNGQKLGDLLNRW